MFLQKRVQESLFIEPTSTREVFKAQAGLKAHKLSGFDYALSVLVKTAAVVIAHTLSFFINLSFDLGLFPDSTKEAKVIPVFKNGNTQLMSNYCSISVLLNLSKIFEKFFYKRLFSFFD